MLMKDDISDFQVAIYELGKLCGIHYPAGELMAKGGTKPITIFELVELISKENQNEV